MSIKKESGNISRRVSMHLCKGTMSLSWRTVNPVRGNPTQWAHQDLPNKMTHGLWVCIISTLLFLFRINEDVKSASLLSIPTFRRHPTSCNSAVPKTLRTSDAEPKRIIWIADSDSILDAFWTRFSAHSKGKCNSRKELADESHLCRGKLRSHRHSWPMLNVRGRYIMSSYVTSSSPTRYLWLSGRVCKSERIRVAFS